MQRMLVVLVVLLTVVVAVLGVTVYDLKDRVEQQRSRTSTANAPGRSVDTAPPAATPNDKRVVALERELARLKRQVTMLRARPVAPAKTGGNGDGPELGAPIGGERPPVTRDGTGEFVITEEDEAYFQAVQERVQYRRRIDGMASNIMRRIERLATRGEISALDDATKEQLSPLVRKYVVNSDDLVNRYLRKPNDEIKQHTAQERRDMMATEREALVAQAQAELTPILGAENAEKVAKESIQNPWGLRYRGRGDRNARRRNR